MKKNYAMQYKKYQNQAGMNLTPPPPSQNSRVVIAKFHYTDTDTDPNGPARTQRSFAANKSVSVSVSV